MFVYSYSAWQNSWHGLLHMRRAGHCLAHSDHSQQLRRLLQRAVAQGEVGEAKRGAAQGQNESAWRRQQSVRSGLVALQTQGVRDQLVGERQRAGESNRQAAELERKAAIDAAKQFKIPTSAAAAATAAAAIDRRQPEEEHAKLTQRRRTTDGTTFDEQQPQHQQQQQQP